MTKMKPINLFVLLLCFALLTACSSKKVLAGAEVDPKASVKGVIKGHYDNQLRFNTLSGRVKIDHTNGDDSQGFNVSLRMQKDSVIWISATLGIVKAKITPEKVSFYNKLEGEFFEGDFSYLSEILGVELDFDKVQNLLLGQALEDLRERKYRMQTLADAYELKPKAADLFLKSVLRLEPRNLRVADQQLVQPAKNRKLHIDYSNYQEVAGQALPNKVHIEAMTDKDSSTIDLEFRNMELNANMRFPFRVPEGYKEIVLK